MRKSSPLAKKIASYTTFAGAVSGFASSADAQIIHVDIANAVIGPNDTQTFDLDGDSNADVQFLQYHTVLPSYGAGAAYAPGISFNFAYLAACRANVSFLGTGLIVQKLNSNDNIQVNNSYFGNPKNLENFAVQGEKFIGVKFTANTINYFGWIRISVATDRTSITVLDWAYTPYIDISSSIKAGQTSGFPTSIKPEVVTSLFNVSVSPIKVIDKVRICTQDAGNYQIIDVDGAIVAQDDLVIGENTINASLLNKGIYLIKVSSANGSVVKRIVKE